jgi:hypothetical protein
MNALAYYEGFLILLFEVMAMFDPLSLFMMLLLLLLLLVVFLVF